MKIIDESINGFSCEAITSNDEVFEAEAQYLKIQEQGTKISL